MKHYQKLYYKHFYAQNENGEYVPVTKQVCFAAAETPDENNPYKQRWFYDPEAGYAVRLARTSDGDQEVISTSSVGLPGGVHDYSRIPPADGTTLRSGSGPILTGPNSVAANVSQPSGWASHSPSATAVPYSGHQAVPHCGTAGR